MSDLAPASFARYARQMRLPQIGAEGQRRLAGSSVLVVGLGALGSVAADLLARAGVGRLRLLDRDVVELTNLQRQTLYSAADIGSPKAHAAAARLAAVNPDIAITPLATDYTPASALDLSAGADLLIDATDNAQTRYLINDVSLELAVPWVYGGAVGTEGRAAAFKPLAARESGGCLRCLFPTPPGPGELPTCDTAGVLNTATSLVATLQVNFALRLLLDPDYQPAELLTLQLWPFSLRTIALTDLGCPTCREGRREFLRAATPPLVTLCGRDTVQVAPTTRPGAPLDLAELERRLAPVGTVQRTAFVLRITPHEAPHVQATIFPDARLLISGLALTSDLAPARGWYDRLVGS